MTGVFIEALARTTGRRARLTFPVGVPGSLPDVPTLLAGVAEVDLTPPPGLPRAGYSRNAHTGMGFRTRLRARVVHLRAGTTSLALITTDLLGGSALVQRLVADTVAASTDVPLAGILLGATHTHGAPGQFHGTNFYNRFSSNAPGLDPRWTAFVAAQLSSAVLSAVSSREPAALAWGRVPVPGVARNRSLPAHLLNPSATAETSVNPSLELLRVDAVSGAPLAALAVFSIHGTCVPMASSTYNADLFSYVCSSFSASVPGVPVVGVLQGTHGDQTPALRSAAGHPEAARIGGVIGSAAASLYTSLYSSLSPSVVLAAGFREVPFASLTDLPARPAVGAALVAGAKENETPVVTRIPPFRAGYGKRFSRSEHGAKWVLGSRWLQPLILPLGDFPRVLPVHVLRIGPVALAGVPFEVTLASGRRFAAAVEAGFGPGSPVRAVVSSVADEYAGYCTTAEEYQAQYYEGGHTLYGPRTQAVTASVLQDLAGAVASSASSGGVVQPERVFDLRVRSYLPAGWDWTAPAGGSLRVAGPASPGHDEATGETYTAWPLTGPAPHRLRWHEPLVRLDTPSGPIPDGDGRLEIIHHPTPAHPAFRAALQRLLPALRPAPLRAALQRLRLGHPAPAEPPPPADHHYTVRWYPTLPTAAATLTVLAGS